MTLVALCPLFYLFFAGNLSRLVKRYSRRLAEARGSRLGLGNSKVVKRLVQQVQCFFFWLSSIPTQYSESN